MDPYKFESTEYFIIKSSKYQYKTVSVNLEGKKEESFTINIPSDGQFKEIVQNIAKVGGAGWRQGNNLNAGYKGKMSNSKSNMTSNATSRGINIDVVGQSLGDVGYKGKTKTMEGDEKNVNIEVEGGEMIEIIVFGTQK
jgi:hypothetical protein